MTNLQRFWLRLRYFLRFRRWPRNLTIAGVNLEAGTMLYVDEGVALTASNGMPPDAPIGYVVDKNTIRIGGKSDADESAERII